uniref:caveolin-2-like n=1 Tax=Oncorhynchus gorbuscha TaxID=8017 RepID=UPI001EAF5C98|nr:caveolin-2-like [Oncorhynchus gorbuscha]
MLCVRAMQSETFFCGPPPSRVLMPVVRSCLMALPSVQVVWSSLTDIFVTPLFHSMGRCLSSVHVKAMDI